MTDKHKKLAEAVERRVMDAYEGLPRCLCGAMWDTDKDRCVDHGMKFQGVRHSGQRTRYYKPIPDLLAALEGWLMEQGCFVGIGNDEDGWTCGYYRKPVSKDEAMPFAVGSGETMDDARITAALEAERRAG